MDTTITENFQKEANGEETEKLNWYNAQVLKFEKSRFGAMALMLVFQTCYGSIAAGLSYNNETMTNLIVCTIFSSLNNTFLISQSPAKWCMGVFTAATLVNTIIIIFELIA